MSAYKQFKTFLQQTSFLTEADCALFENNLELNTYSKKEHHLKEGQICHLLGFVNKGCFRVFYLSEGREINTQFIFENEFVVDYDSFLKQQPSRYYIQAMEDAEIVTFNFETLQKAYDQSHRWERFGRLIAEKSYQVTTNRVESFLFKKGEQRYIEALEQVQLFQRIPLYHIASYLGIERESLSRLRKKIVQKKLL
ncbi:MAG: Crp/Fnr family transcriptional regulator [Aureispira sp.]